MPGVLEGAKRNNRWVGLLRETFMVSPWPARVLRIALAGVFIWAGAVKIWDPRAFARTISGYGLVPDELLVPVALGLPALELLAGLGLALNWRWSHGAVLGLLILFMAVLGFGIWNDLDVDCGCFSQQELKARLGLRIAFVRDLVMLAAVGYLILWRRHRTNLAEVAVDFESNQ